jgi:hypothetical protein
LSGHLRGQFVGSQLLATGDRFIDPRAKVGWGEVGEVEEEIRHVPFGIDDQSRDPG